MSDTETPRTLRDLGRAQAHPELAADATPAALAAVIRSITDLWDEPLDDDHDTRVTHLAEMVSSWLAEHDFRVRAIARDAAGAEVTSLTARAEKAERAAVTLGKIVDAQCRDIARITGSEHMVDEDGDADWGAIWSRGYGMAGRLRTAEAEVAALRSRLARVEALADEWERRATDPSVSRSCIADLRATLASVGSSGEAPRLDLPDAELDAMHAEFGPSRERESGERAWCACSPSGLPVTTLIRRDLPTRACRHTEPHRGHAHVNGGPDGGCGLPEWCPGVTLPAPVLSEGQADVEDDVPTLLELQLSAELAIAAAAFGITFSDEQRDGIAVRLVAGGWTCTDEPDENEDAVQEPDGEGSVDPTCIQEVHESDPVRIRLGSANRFGEWLRDRADRIEREGHR